MTKKKKKYAQSATGELIVPAMMLLCVGIYWIDAYSLSIMALVFPMALTAIVILASAIVMITAFTSPNLNNMESKKDGIAFFTKTWAIVLLPVPLIYFWRNTGAIPVLFLYTLCVLFLLGERKRLRLVVIPSILSVSLVYLFKTILYVRLPDIPLVFGG